MSKHYKIQCRSCKSVIAQCRCPGPKEIEWRDSCDKCFSSTEATLKEGEFHPVAESALIWFQKWRTKDIKRYMMLREAVASTAIEGNRTAELLNSTLNRLDSGEPVSDRYLLALCWFVRYEYDPSN